MKIAVVGAGAMGSIYAGLFADAGNDVIAIARNREHVDAINKNGLRVEGASGDRIVKLRAFIEVPEEKVDLVILAVKAAGINDACNNLDRLIGEETLVLTLQNGLGSAEKIATKTDADKLAVGIAGGFGAAVKAPAHVYHSGMQKVQMGAYAGLGLDKVQGIAALWSDAGFNVAAVTDILRMQWEKLICNVAFSAICTLNGLRVGEVRDDPDLWALALAAAQEAADVAKAGGTKLGISSVEDHVANFAAQVMDSKPSMLVDHERQRQSEIDMINGAVPREALKCGTTAPINQTLTTLVKYREKRFS